MKNLYSQFFRAAEILSQKALGKGWGAGTTAIEVRQCLSVIRDPVVVIDCGGNRGKWSDALLENANPKTLIIVEPDAGNASFLRDRFHHRPNVHVVEAALSNLDGQADFFADKPGSSLASLHQRDLRHFNRTHEKVATVATTTYTTMLDVVGVGSAVDLLKIDIEGHELALLTDIPRAIRLDIRAIQFEFGGANIDSRTYFRDFWNLLRDDFSFHRMSPVGLLPVADYREVDETMRTTNYLCVRKASVHMAG